MKLSVIALVTSTVLLTSCASVSQVSDSGLCRGLMGPIDDHAQALLDENQKVPASVVLTGTRVIVGFDAECSRP